jgi:hypothetical protein
LISNFFCASGESALMPNTTAPAFSNCFTRPVNAIASLVQPLVLALG